MLKFIDYLPVKSSICVTIETNRWYPEVMGNSPYPVDRVVDLIELGLFIELPIYITIEPIMDFDTEELVDMIRYCNVTQVNIGSDSGRNGLPEPSGDKIMELVGELEKFTRVHYKSNLKRCF